MKIIAGKFGGRSLNFRVRRGLRVTSQKVKEAMFSIIGDAVKDALVMDLFCGFGTLGIEAISRGARKVIFVDVDGQALKQLTHYLDQLEINSQATTIKRDSVKTVKHSDKESYDLIIMDPPYHLGCEENALKAIDKYQVLKIGGICIVEHYFENIQPDRVGELVKYKEKRYGDTGVAFYRRQLPQSEGEPEKESGEETVPEPEGESEGEN